MTDSVAVGEVPTKTSFGILFDKFDFAATATGGPSGKSMVELEKAGSHHLAFVLTERVTSPPFVFVISTFARVLSINSEYAVCIKDKLSRYRVK